jgi:hypothetical protein
MDPFEDSIGGSVAAMPFPPPFDDSSIVPEYFDAAAHWA